MPRASTRTEMPVALVKAGRIAASSPELSTEVVDARVIDCVAGSACPATGGTSSSAAIASRAILRDITNPPYRGDRPSSAKASPLMKQLKPIRKRPKPSASGRFPLLVSRATAVVIVRV